MKTTSSAHTSSRLLSVGSFSSGGNSRRSSSRTPSIVVPKTLEAEDVVFMKNFVIAVATVAENYKELSDTLLGSGAPVVEDSGGGLPSGSVDVSSDGQVTAPPQLTKASSMMNSSISDSIASTAKPTAALVGNSSSLLTALTSLLDDITNLPIKDFFNILDMRYDKEEFSARDEGTFGSTTRRSVAPSWAPSCGTTRPQSASSQRSFPYHHPLVQVDAEDTTPLSSQTENGVHAAAAPVDPSIITIVPPQATDESSLYREPRENSLPNSTISDDRMFGDFDLTSVGGEPGSGEWRKRKSVFFTDTLVKDRADDGLKTINNYTILDELGRGSFGKVKLAAVGDSNDMRAIKIIPKRLLRAKYRFDDMMQQDGGGEKEVGRFHKEVAIMKKLKHRNIVRLHEVIDDPHSEKLYMVLQYVERGPILNLDGDGRCTALDIDVAKGYMKQIANAVAYLHSVKICHRDIKPDNILLGANGLPYLSDFGVSSMLDSDEASEVPGQTAGTPAFLAPEEFTADVSISALPNPFALDIWALGVTFYCMIFGVMPFHPGGSYLEISERVRTQEVEYPHLDPLPTQESEFGASFVGSGCMSVTTPLLDNDDMASSTTSTTPSRFGMSIMGGASFVGMPISGRPLQEEALVDLLRGMLERDVMKRFSIQQVRKHPFFTGKPLRAPTGTNGQHSSGNNPLMLPRHGSVAGGSNDEPVPAISFGFGGPRSRSGSELSSDVSPPIPTIAPIPQRDAEATNPLSVATTSDSRDAASSESARGVVSMMHVDELSLTPEIRSPRQETAAKDASSSLHSSPPPPVQNDSSTARGSSQTTSWAAVSKESTAEPQLSSASHADTMAAHSTLNNSLIHPPSGHNSGGSHGGGGGEMFDVESDEDDFVSMLKSPPAARTRQVALEPLSLLPHELESSATSSRQSNTPLRTGGSPPHPDGVNPIHNSARAMQHPVHGGGGGSTNSPTLLARTYSAQLPPSMSLAGIASGRHALSLEQEPRQGLHDGSSTGISSVNSPSNLNGSLAGRLTPRKKRVANGQSLEASITDLGDNHPTLCGSGHGMHPPSPHVSSSSLGPSCMHSISDPPPQPPTGGGSLRRGSHLASSAQHLPSLLPDLGVVSPSGVHPPQPARALSPTSNSILKPTTIVSVPVPNNTPSSSIRQGVDQASSPLHRQQHTTGASHRLPQFKIRVSDADVESAVSSVSFVERYNFSRPRGGGAHHLGAPRRQVQRNSWIGDGAGGGSDNVEDGGGI